MASLRRSRIVQSGLQDQLRPRGTERRRGIAVAAVIAAALLVLAWYEGGEEPLRPIAEPVVLPEQAR